MAKADLHIHSRVSDGLATVAQLIEYADRQTDLDLIAVTDHEDASGGQRARETAAKRGARVKVVVGAEITTLQGHVLALFVESAPKSFRSIERTLEAIHAQGGIAIAPHPMSWLTRSVSQRTLERLHERAEPGVTFDAIELANPSPAGRQRARRAARLNARWGLAITGGSDAHHLKHVATGWTRFDGATPEDLKTALLAGVTGAARSHYPPLREIGLGRAALGLAWGYAATPRKMLRITRGPRKAT